MTLHGRLCSPKQFNILIFGDSFSPNFLHRGSEMEDNLIFVLQVTPSKLVIVPLRFPDMV